MSGGIQLHPRRAIVARARSEFHQWTCDWMERHDLTWIEAIKVMAETVADYMRYPLRSERHPDDPEKKADEA